MTSEERKAARYARRVQKRAEKKATCYAQCDNFDAVFSYDNLYRSYKLCRRGVAWKCSTQKYMTQAPLNVFTTYRLLQTGKFKSKGFVEFDIFERGKIRHIRSVAMEERVVQRCLCDHSLVPMLGRTFIYDNGASLKGKGYSFSVDRMCHHLRQHYKKHGNEGYVLLFDFSKFFDNVSHRIMTMALEKNFTDERLLRLAHHFIDAFGDVGLGLGSQISQTMALASANRLDHFVKEVLRIKGYGRYMDDGYLLHPSKEYLKTCLEALKAICKELEIKLNVKKTQIVKISHGFSFLKVRFFLTKTGKVIRRMHRAGIVRMRKKLKAFQRMVAEGKMQVDDVHASFQSWQAYTKNFNGHKTLQSANALYDKLFIHDWLCRA